MKELQSGDLLDNRYSIIQSLAQGGFGRTYIAEDRRRPGNPQCVVKQLKPESSHPRLLETAQRLFFTEAEILEKLGNHSQIPRLLAYFQEADDFYLIQEFVRGQPLTDELNLGSSWSEEKICRMLESVLQVMSFVHYNGVIHRDIKPDNIIRRYADEALVLVDFGTVKQVRNQLTTSHGQIARTVAVGTPGYMPTEQSRGNPRHNSDIYALGMVAIQAATGLNLTQLQEDPSTGELIWQPWAKISKELSAILFKMVRYHFKDRYQSVDEVLQDLSESGLISLENLPVNDSHSSQRVSSESEIGPVDATNDVVGVTTSQNLSDSTESGIIKGRGEPEVDFQKASKPTNPTVVSPQYPNTRRQQETIISPTDVLDPDRPQSRHGSQPTAVSSFPPSADANAVDSQRNNTSAKASPSYREASEPNTHTELRQAFQFAALLGSGSWILAIALISFVGTAWLVTGFWLAIVAVTIFIILAKQKPLVDQLLWFAITIVSTGVSLMFAAPQNIAIDSLFSVGFLGWLAVFIVAIFAGAFAFILLTLSQSITS